MKNRDNIALLTMACIGTTLVYKCYTEFIRRKRLKDAILKFYRNEDTIKDFLYLYSIENTDEISNYLALSYYKKGIWNEALKYTKSDKVKYECYIRLERYKDALLCGFSIYFCKNDDKILEKVKNVMKLYVNEQVTKHKVKRVSDIAYREFFETFPLLFNNFTIETKIEVTNKSKNTETQNDIDFSSISIAKNKNIRKCVYEKIKFYVENSQIDKLRGYTKHRSDNLSNFVKLAFALIESNMPDTLTKIELNSDYTNEQSYEHKVFTYCTLLINFYTQTPAQYSYQDISTMFYELKMNGSDTEELIGKIMRYKSYSFVFHHLLQQNFFLVDEAYKLFPTDPKILSLACEIYISTKEYEKADNTIVNLDRYCTNDPRTYICMFYKARITNDKDKRYLQKAESLDCYFYRTYLLLANCYKESDSRVFLEYLQNAKECCNNYDALGEIFELEIIEEAKSILNNSLL